MGSFTSKSKTKSNKRNSYIAGKPSAPGKPTLKYDPENLDPDTITIKWDPPLFDGGSKITGYLVEHRRTGSPHWVKASPIKVRQTQLTICGLEPGWRYQFRITAENEIGLSEPSVLSEPLTIFVNRSAAIAPYFITELKDIVVLENEKVEFNVCFEGVPNPKISWYKDGLETFSNRCQKIVTEDNISTFIIYEASISDESEIKCSATNRVGYAVVKAYLKVEAPPNIRLPRQYEEGLIFEKGETIRLKVSIAGQPQPSSFWYFNGDELIPSNKYEIEYADKTAVLKVKNAQRSDRGDYQIQAVNELGKDVASILVTIANRPQPPQQISVDSIQGRFITLSWLKPDDDGGCKIGTYIIEYYKTGWNVWLKAGTSRQLSINLDELIEGSEYKFRVKAENPYGVSDPSPETEPVFIPDPKRGIYEASNIIDDVESNLPHIVYQREMSPVKNNAKKNIFEKNSSPRSSIFFDFQDTKWAEKKSQTPVKPKRKNKTSNSNECHNLVNRDVSYFSDTEFDKLNIPHDNRLYTPSPQPSSSNMDDTSRTSSELMLVLVPDNENTTHNKGSLNDLSSRLSKRNFSSSQIVPPPISLSAPELGCEMAMFKPLQRNCVSSSEILHESTVARLHQDKLLDEYDQDRISGIDRRTSKLQNSLFGSNFTTTETKKISDRLLSEEIVNDLSKINEFNDTRDESALYKQYRIGDDHSEIKTFKKYTNINHSRSKHFDTEISHELSSVHETSSEEGLNFIPKRTTSSIPRNALGNTQPAKLNRNNTKRYQNNGAQKLENELEKSNDYSKCSCSSDINNSRYSSSSEKCFQGRYSPESGTFHYPDLFMESLTKSPKFKPTTNSFTEVVAELVSRKTKNSLDCSANNANIANTPASQTATELNGFGGTLYSEQFQSSSSTTDGFLYAEYSANKIIDDNYRRNRNETVERNNCIDEDSDSEITESEDDDDDDDVDESDEEDDELLYDYMLENENHTYHPEIRAPLSFEEALAISNPKRNVSPTNDMFLESENTYDDGDEGLHFFNKNYSENDNDLENANFGANRQLKSYDDSQNQEKLPRSILKSNVQHAEHNDTSVLSRPAQQTAVKENTRSSNPAPKKQVRIEEPTRIEKHCDEHVVINHYSDIVKQFGNVQKPPVKRYLTYDELKAAAQVCENEENLDDSIYDARTGNINFDRDKTDETYNFAIESKTNAAQSAKNNLNLVKVHRKVRFFFSFFFDIVIFAFACWLYCFKDEKLAIPVIVLMVYRQLYDKIKTKFSSFKIWNRRKTKTEIEFSTK